MFNSLFKSLISNTTRKVISVVPGFAQDLFYFMRGPFTYFRDGLLTVHNADFLKNSRFSEAYETGKRTGSWAKGEPAWRVYICCWAASKALDLDGDFVECGVNKGGFSLAVMQYISFEKEMDRKFWLLDTFCGLSDKYVSNQERELGVMNSGYSECYDQVVMAFLRYKNVRIIRGTVPDTLDQVKAEKVCYLSIDMNCVMPEIAAAEFFWDKLVSGAVMVLDDYGWKKHISQKHAFDEFAKTKGVQVLCLPTGQGLIFKP